MVAMPPAKRRTGLNPLAYMGVEPLSPLEFVINPRNPTQSDNGFNIGTIWLNNVTEDPWMLVNLNQRIATWLQFGSAGSGDLDTLTGNIGGAVGPDGSQNINVLADPTSGLSITGNPGTNTLTIFTQSGNRILTTLTGDAGAAAVSDVNENINILGGANINTSTPGGGSDVTINLNNVIRWENTDVGGTQGVLYMEAASPGVGGIPFLHNAGDRTNAFLGIDAGSLTVTGTANTALGFDAGHDISSGQNNTFIGSECGASIDAGTSNTAVGRQALNFETSGNNNCAFGEECLILLGTGTAGGSNNIAMGFQAAANYTDNESSNIIIGNFGGTGESNTIRIGTQGAGVGQQNRAFMAGIVGVSPSNQASVVIDTTTGQLGVGGGGGHAGDNHFLATQAATGGGTIFSGTGTGIYYMGSNSIMTEVFDPDNVFFPGDGVGGNATFTAPADGIYQFEWVSMVNGTAVSGVGLIVYQPCFVINMGISSAFCTRENQIGSGDNTDRVNSRVLITLNLTTGDVVEFGLAIALALGGGTGVDFSSASGVGAIPGNISGLGNWICGFRVA